MQPDVEYKWVNILKGHLLLNIYANDMSSSQFIVLRTVSNYSIKDGTVRSFKVYGINVLCI